MKKTDLQTEDFSIMKGVAAGFFFLFVTAFVTGLIPNPVYVRMVSVTPIDYFFLLSTSLLAGLYFGKENCSVTGERLAGLSGFMGFFAFSCPICNMFLLAFFSSSALMAYFDPLRPYLGLISTLLLGYFFFRDFFGEVTVLQK